MGVAGSVPVACVAYSRGWGHFWWCLPALHTPHWVLESGRGCLDHKPHSASGQLGLPAPPRQAPELPSCSLPTASLLQVTLSGVGAKMGWSVNSGQQSPEAASERDMSAGKAATERAGLRLSARTQVLVGSRAQCVPTACLAGQCSLSFPVLSGTAGPSCLLSCSALQEQKGELRKRLSYTTHKLEKLETEFDSTRHFLEIELRRAQEELDKVTEKLRR